MAVQVNPTEQGLLHGEEEETAEVHQVGLSCPLQFLVMTIM